MGRFRQLTFDGRLKFSPVVHPAGQVVVYVDFETPELFRLKLLDLQTGGTGALHPAATTSELEPRISADGKQYAFVRTKGPLTLSVVVRDWSGGPEFRGEVPPPPGFAGYRSPAFPRVDGRIAYSFADGGRQQIVISNFDGSGRESLVDSPGINNWPDFSPDGGAMVFGSSRDGNFEIYAADAGGHEPRRLTASPRQDLRPRYSPSGDAIAFTSHRGGHAEIYVMDPEGGAPHQVTDQFERSDYATWHPDGQRLVFVGERGGRTDLFEFSWR